MAAWPALRGGEAGSGDVCGGGVELQPGVTSPGNGKLTSATRDGSSGSSDTMYSPVLAVAGQGRLRLHAVQLGRCGRNMRTEVAVVFRWPRVRSSGR